MQAMNDDVSALVDGLMKDLVEGLIKDISDKERIASITPKHIHDTLHRHYLDLGGVIPLHLNKEKMKLKLVTARTMAHKERDLIIDKTVSFIAYYCHKRDIRCHVMNTQEKADIFVGLLESKNRPEQRDVFIFHSLFMRYDNSVELIRSLQRDHPVDAMTLLQTVFVFVDGQFFSIPYQFVNDRLLDELLDPLLKLESIRCARCGTVILVENNRSVCKRCKTTMCCLCVTKKNKCCVCKKRMATGL